MVNPGGIAVGGPTSLADESGDTVNVNNPLPINNDSVYIADVDLANSSSADFTGGDVRDLFNDLESEIVNSTGNNPKTVVIALNRFVVTNGMVIAGSYSNVKIEVQQGGSTWTTVRDESTNPVVFSARFYSFSTQVGNDLIGVIGISAVRITFNTVNAVTLSSMRIGKAQDVIATLQGLKPDGVTTFIGATPNNNLQVAIQEYGDTPAIDAFARLRTSNPLTIFDSKQLHDKQPLFWDEVTGGSATSVHVPADAMTEMTVTANAADYVIRQTKQRFNYQPGKSQLVFMTFRSPQVSGITCRVGLFDDDGAGNNLTPNNGIFFECDGDISWNIAKDGAITETVTQANWNLDKLDGTGKSGIALDLTATQIMIIDYEWLGVGRVRVGFVIDGLIYYAHYFNHANDPAFDSVYMSTPNLPLRYSIETDGTNGSVLDHICSSVISEGGVEKTGVLRTVKQATTLTSSYTTGNSYALLGIRLKAAYKDVTVIPESVSIALGSNDAFIWSLQLNPVINNPFNYVGVTNSSIELAQGVLGNTIATAGIEVGGGAASSAVRGVSEELQTALRIGSTIAGVNDELVLVLTPLTTNQSAVGLLNIRELL